MQYLRWRRARWAVPAAVVVAIGGGALVPTLGGASPPPELSARTTQQLLADIAQAKPPALTGTLTWTANLGLSDLSSLEGELGESAGPGGGASDAFNPLSLLSGSYPVSVWLDGAHAEHLALNESPTHEVDLVRNGNQAWLWDSADQSVTHLVFEPGSSPSGTTGAGGSSTATATVLTPQQFASRLLARLDPTTSVTTGTPLYVAGQPAYQLLVAPKSAPGSTVGHIEVDVGAKGTLAGVPLQVAVYANGQQGPAVELGFTGSLSLGVPPSRELTFTAPPGANVTTHDVTVGGERAGSAGASPSPSPSPSVPLGPLGLQRLGTGWTTVVTGTARALTTPSDQAELGPVTTPVQVQVAGQQYQARLFSTDLLNVLVMPDGQFYAGFVTAHVLEADASTSS
ncbi:MAG: hypothetical protein ACRDZX_05685 [Acidimicrobiales bacterium]